MHWGAGSGFSYPPAVEAWMGQCMVVVLLMHCLMNMGERGESNDASLTFGWEMHLASVECLAIAGGSLRDSLEESMSNTAVDKQG